MLRGTTTTGSPLRLLFAYYEPCYWYAAVAVRARPARARAPAAARPLRRPALRRPALRRPARHLRALLPPRALSDALVLCFQRGRARAGGLVDFSAGAVVPGACAGGLVDFSACAVVPDARAGGLADFGAGALVPDARAGGLAG